MKTALIVLVIVSIIGISWCDRERRQSSRGKCRKTPPFPTGCHTVETIYTRSCITGYKCIKNSDPACAAAPICEPQPQNDCVTSQSYKSVNGVRCAWGCRHYCCTDPVKMECPKTSPTNPYCIATTIVNYTINGKECPVYCSCVPDCSKLTC